MKYDKERKEWNSLLHRAYNVIPIKQYRGTKIDLKLLDLYLRKKNDDTLFWHNIWMVILTSLIVILTAVNIWLNFYR